MIARTPRHPEGAGWEMKKIDPKYYWDQFLPKLTGAMHFYDGGPACWASGRRRSDFRPLVY